LRQVENDLLTAEEKAALEDELVQFLGDTETRIVINYHSRGTVSQNRETGATTETGATDLTSKGAFKIKPTEADLAEMRAAGASEIYLVSVADITSEPTVQDWITLEEDTLVTNGTFASDTGWTKGTGWTIASGAATKTAGLASDLYQDISAVDGVVYQLVFTITAYTAGTLTPDIGGTNGTARTAAGTYVEEIACGSSNSRITFEAGNTFDGSIDNVYITGVLKYVKSWSKPIPGIHYRLLVGDTGN
jgi:hypothetical protein